MSIEVRYDEEHDSIIITVHGVLDRKSGISLRDRILTHQQFRKNINQIFDCSSGKLELTTEDLKVIAAHFNQKSEVLGGNRKLALVVSRDLDFGMMRQYEAFFYTGPEVLVHSFRSLEKAIKWIKGLHV